MPYSVKSLYICWIFNNINFEYRIEKNVEIIT